MREVAAPVLIAVYLSVLTSGCATVNRPAVMTEERFAQVQTTCESATALGVDASQAKTALGAGALAGVVFAFQGAADGVKWGAITGGDAGKGAWIGAVAGVGIGLLVGVVIGTKRGIDAYREYRAGYERCMTAGLQPAETGAPEPQPPVARAPEPDEPTP